MATLLTKSLLQHHSVVHVGYSNLRMDVVLI